LARAGVWPTRSRVIFRYIRALLSAVPMLKRAFMAGAAALLGAAAAWFAAAAGGRDRDDKTGRYRWNVLGRHPLNRR
jgi:hypothetical protein